MVTNTKNCGLIFIQEINHNFSVNFRKNLTSLQKTVFSLFQIPDSLFINVLLCNQQKSRELNYQFCKKNYATDVLSWSYKDEKKKHEILVEFPWGEIMICFELCKQQALENGWDFEIEFLRLLVHGLLHLGGYEHSTQEKERKMLAKEKELLKSCNLSFIYP